tara:strand:+ start:744 stop:1712 length:969 start_codon:yes stop_codon:yes gene_type:complete
MLLSKKHTILELAEKYNCKIKGDKDTNVSSLASLVKPTDDSLVFMSDKKMLKLIDDNKISCLLTTQELSASIEKSCLISSNPQLTFSRMLRDNTKEKIHAHDIKDISKFKNIASTTLIANSADIADDVTMGDNCIVYPNVTIYGNVQLGNNVIIHSGAVIGADGFGLVLNEKNSWEKIPQVGGVSIGNSVEIGANTTIDRGSLDMTMIGDNVKIDNLVHVAHNVQIGTNTAIAACVGIAGSTIIGKNCTLGGGSGVNGHINISDDVHIHGMTMVTKSLLKPGSYASGTTVEPVDSWRRNQARFKSLDDTLKKVNRSKGEKYE